MKTLETARLRLRQRTLDDLEPILAMDADEEVHRYIGGLPEPVAHRIEVRRNIVEHTTTYLRWAIEWRDRPGFLGQCGLRPCHLTDVTELTWRLARAHWGHGIASEAARAMLCHARAAMGIGAVAASSMPTIGVPGESRKSSVCGSPARPCSTACRSLSTDWTKHARHPISGANSRGPPWLKRKCP
jgi:RimJ/RimL family protein N-acetyltransferase